LTFEMGVVWALIVVVLYLFTREDMAIDLVAVLASVLLMMTGVLTPAEGLSGFSNAATGTVAAMFVLSAAVSKTEIIELLGLQLRRLTRLPFTLSLLCMMLGVATISAFINNTATVALLIPVVLSVCRDIDSSPSRWLLPLSFASLVGGMCTLVGTSTNILVSSLAKDNGLEPFGMLEFAPLGLLMMVTVIPAMAFFGYRLLPSQPAEQNLSESFEMGEYIVNVVVPERSELVGKSVDQFNRSDLDILELVRENERIAIPDPQLELKANDTLVVRCSVSELKKLRKREEVTFLPERSLSDDQLESDDAMLVEAVIAPDSDLVGRKLEDTRFFETHEASVLALRHHGGLKHSGVASRNLIGGDSLLLKVMRRQLENLRRDPSLIVVSSFPDPRVSGADTAKVVGVLACVFLSVALGLLPVLVAALAGCLALVFLNCLKLEEVYQSIEWKVIFLLGGVLPLGLALEKTGGASLIGETIVDIFGQFGPQAVMSALYMVTALLTAVMSNNATAALLTPIAIVTAENLGVDPRPFLVAITFGASTAFMTPMGYQTNLMVYSAGGYQFNDYLKVGIPLNLLCWVVASVAIPWIWAF